jgi:hypothetical protein
MKTQAEHSNVANGFVEFMLEKEAAVFGASAPDIVDVDHSGISYEARRNAYLRYVTAKSKEQETGVGKAGLVGAGIGAGVGGVLGLASGRAGAGAAAGAFVGGVTGLLAGVADRANIQEAKSALISRSRLGEQLQRRMAARQASREREERQHRNMHMYHMMSSSRRD